MAASKETIRGWLVEGEKRGATHVLSVCDTFDNNDYPVYVMPGEDIRKKMTEYDGVNMQRVNEVYNLLMDVEVQLAADRVMNF